MASIKERNGKFSVIYTYRDADGKRRQKWETYATKSEAVRRRHEVEYRMQEGTFSVPRCTYVRELMEEYISLYGKDKWSLSTFERNGALIRNYILPTIGNKKLDEINTRFLEKYYQTLQTMPAVHNPVTHCAAHETITLSTIRDIHKTLRNCFEQAVKWELMDKNPAIHATVPKYKATSRDIWTAETLVYAMDVCDDNMLKLAMNLAFSGSLRLGELLGLTWDCVDISPEAIREGRAFIFINKELQRVSKTAIDSLEGKDILLIFPEESRLCTTVRVLKTPKTESTLRKVFLPESVAGMLVQRKKEQDEIKEILGKEYQDYDLVMTTSCGMPYSDSGLRKKFNQLIKEYKLPKVVFHSIRHSSVTYKLKLNGGDIKAVQGDSGHSQVSMVTEVYSHIIDEDRRKNAQLFEEAFYGRKNLNPQMHAPDASGGSGMAGSPGVSVVSGISGKCSTLTVPESVDAELLAKVLSNPEMAALITSLAKAMEKKE